MNHLSTNVAAFCALLRAEHGFAIGQAEAHDALRALETVGVADESRVRAALRLVCCARYEETLLFDRAFDAFFRLAPAGAPQPEHRPRHTRDQREATRTGGAERPAEPPNQPAGDGGEGSGGKAAKRRLTDEEPDEATAWRVLRARYSPLAAAAEPPRLTSRNFDRMLVAASALIAGARLGRSRRWRQVEQGRRVDIRRTIRASLQTGGEPLDVRFRSHPPRNPRFVVLIDGSRSLADQTTPIVHFARALCDRSARTQVFFFSTELREVTRELSATNIAGGQLAGVGYAWGGGTKIGATLETFVAAYGGRLLSPETVVLIFSDGLDTGDVRRLERAMREMNRRSAGIVWLNPHAQTPGYRPTARGMRAALPYITLLSAANDARAFAELGQRLAKSLAVATRSG